MSQQDNPNPRAPDSEHDAVLMARAREGNREAFDTVIDRHRDVMSRVARQYNWGQEDDIVQEAIARIWLRIHSYTVPYSVRGWLIGFIKNCSFEEWRRLKKQPRGVSLDDVSEVAETMSREALAKVEGSEVELALGKLSQEDRRLLVLFYWDELSLTEVGEHFGCTANAAKTRLFRARERFRQIWEEFNENK